MRISLLASIPALMLSASVLAIPPSRVLDRQEIAVGSGPYPAAYTTDAALKSHTLYLPKTIPSGVKLPVLLWGEGGCIANGLSFQGLLTNFASYGYLVIASGGPNQSGSTTAQLMTDALAWLPGSSYAGVVDSTRVAVAGQSCGGLEAYTLENDTRVATIGIFNSGLLQNTDDAKEFTKPIFYLLGGSSDIAYANGERDYKNLPAGTPAWKGNLPVGHGGTYQELNGGKFGVVGLSWLEWTLRGNATAKAYLTGSAVISDGWTVESKDLDKLKIPT